MSDNENAENGEQGEQGMQEVVSKVTVKALQEFETDDMNPEGSRPPSGQGSRPESAARSRTGSTGSKRMSKTGSMSKRGSSDAGSKRGSDAGSRKGSADAGSKRGSVAGSKKGSVSGSRKGSNGGSRKGSDAGSTKGSRRGTVEKTEAQSPTGEEPAPSEAATAPLPTPPSPAGSVASLGSRAASIPSTEKPASPAVTPASPGGSAASIKRPVSIPSASVAEAPAGGDGSEAGSGRTQGSGDIPPPDGSQRGSSVGSEDGESKSGTMKFSGSQTLGSDAGDLANLPPGDGGWAQQLPVDGGDDDGLMMTTDPYGGDGGGDPDDDDDDFEEDEGDEDDDDDMEEEEDEEENEMVVLDPDHPLMTRFQKALKSHLEKQNDKATLELMELQASVTKRRKERESIGVELYGVQQELARHQMMLEKKHDEFSNISQNRIQMEAQLDDVRSQYKEQQITVNSEKKQGSELQAEVENLALRLFYMDQARRDVRSDINVMKCAANKAETETNKMEAAKHKQDLYVDRLVERVDKLREEIAMYEAQQTAQNEETRNAKDALNEAHMEIDSINLEKKQLFQQWNSSLIGMRRRDEAHSAMQEALHQQQQRMLSQDTEIEGYKKSINKEQESNEKLTMILSKTDNDIATVKKMLQQCHNKHDALKNEYATYTRMLHETEQALSRANTDKILRENEVTSLRKQIELEYQEKLKLEDAILERLQSQLTLDKAAQYTDKMTRNLRKRSRDLETQVATVENEISKQTLEVSHTKTRTERLQLILDDLDEDIRAKNDIISKSENEIQKRNALIERKQGVIDGYNKKLEQLINTAGGVELGPLEITINSMNKSIDTENQEIQELQQMWLRDESELVRLTKEHYQQGRNVEVMKKQLTILSQKKLRIENEINRQGSDTSEIERSIRNMQNDMLKLNMLLHREKGMGEELQQQNILKENDFMGNLKEAEHESIEMQERLDSLKEEKERLLNALVEAERQIMLWEKKTQLARETKMAVDSEVGMGEIRAMKAEIHRMQVRYTQLMKQQERMIQEMEKAVGRRDTIVTRGDAQTKMARKGTVTKGNFQRQLGEMKKKIKQTIHDANSCDGEIRDLREHQHELSSQLEERQLNVQQLQGNADTLDGDLDRLLETKLKNLSDLVAKQQRTKYYQQLKDGKYTRLCRTDSARETEREKQVERMQALTAIVDRLAQEYPHTQPNLRKVQLAYGSRALEI